MLSFVSRRAGRRFFAGELVLTLAGCAATPLVSPDTGSQIASAIGANRAVELRVDGDPVDVPTRVGERLPLADALILAVERDPRLQAALARVQVALADARQARLLPNPILSLVLRYPTSGGPAEVEAGLTGELAAILERPRRSAAADRRLDAAVADAIATALDTSSNARESYAQVQALDELLPLVRERAALLDRLVELARSRLELGEATRVDVTTIQAQRVELDIEIADLELRRRDVRLALSRAIGEPSGDAAWQLDAWSALPASVPDEVQWIGAALRQRPEIRAAARELDALGDEAAVAALSQWNGSALGVRAERTDDWTIGPELALPLPIFDSGDARRARAAAEIVAARHELVERSRRVVEEVRRAHAAFFAARRSLARVRDELIPLQRQRREDVEAIYLAGQLDVTALLLAEQDLQATQSKLVELEQRATTALIRLERAAGGPAAAQTVLETRPQQLEAPPQER